MRDTAGGGSTDPSARRLCLASLRRLPVDARPAVDPRELSVGIVHLGLGAFHRAHQAVYTQAAMAASGETSWGICGVGQRSRDLIDRLAPQDGLYSVVERGGRACARVLAPLRETLFAPEQADDLTARIASPDTRVVTLTVTEKGYRFDPVTQSLRQDDPDVIADAAAFANGGARPPATVIGQLFRGLARRRDAAGPVTVVCCDNLPGNGKLLRRLVADFAELAGSSGGAGGAPGSGPRGGGSGGHRGADAAAWIAENVRFPSTMVDRVVPATTDADLREAAALLGVEDRAAIVAEPFSQWVIEDDFAGPRPDWEAAGAQLVADVAPYEAAKLRLLNGCHSALAYLGLLAGYEYLADFMAVDGVRAWAGAFMDADAAPTLKPPPGFDLPGYQAAILRRFANPGVRYRLSQIAGDGSQKLPQRIVPVLAGRRSSGETPRYAVLAVAAWMRCVSAGLDDGGRPIRFHDPMTDELAGRLADAATATGSDGGAVIDALLGVTQIFGAELRADAELRDVIARAYEELARHGAAASLRGLLAG